MIEKEEMTRREFLKTLGRFSFLTGLTALGGTLIKRSVEEECFHRFICPSCPAVSDCGLPQALSYRRSREERE